jgi:hypothetical protein
MTRSFAVSLAMGKVELMAGWADGRARLLKLEQAAKAKGHLQVARLAREALDGKPCVNGSAAPCWNPDPYWWSER